MTTASPHEQRVLTTSVLRDNLLRFFTDSGAREPRRMRCGSVTLAAASIGLACLAASCVPPASVGTSPGCLIHLYTGPNLTGSGIPVARDSPEFAPAWQNSFTSARIIWGTWRLFASPGYTDFMGDYSSPAIVPQLRPNNAVKSVKCLAPEPPPPLPPSAPGVYVAP